MVTLLYLMPLTPARTRPLVRDKDYIIVLYVPVIKNAYLPVKTVILIMMKHLHSKRGIHTISDHSYYYYCGRLPLLLW